MKIAQALGLVLFLLLVVATGLRAESMGVGDDPRSFSVIAVTDGNAVARRHAGRGDLVKAALALVSRILWRDSHGQSAKSSLEEGSESVIASANYSIDADAEKIGMRLTWNL
jgi:hypothetical protein